MDVDKKLKLIIHNTVEAVPFPDTEAEITSAIVAGITDGDEPILNAAKLRILSRGIDAALKDETVVDAVRSQLELHPKGKATYNGISVSVGTTATKYDYAGCNHPEWDAIVKCIFILDARKKRIEEELRILHKQAYDTNVNKDRTAKTIIVESFPSLTEVPYGEVVEINPPTVTSKTAIFVK